jgi:hypothetical protein
MLLSAEAHTSQVFGMTVCRVLASSNARKCRALARQIHLIIQPQWWSKHIMQLQQTFEQVDNGMTKLLQKFSYKTAPDETAMYS